MENQDQDGRRELERLLLEEEPPRLRSRLELMRSMGAEVALT